MRRWSPRSGRAGCASGPGEAFYFYTLRARRSFNHRNADPGNANWPFSFGLGLSTLPFGLGAHVGTHSATVFYGALDNPAEGNQTAEAPHAAKHAWGTGVNQGRVVISAPGQAPPATDGTVV